MKSPYAIWTSPITEEQDSAALLVCKLQEIIDILAESGAFQEFNCSPPECGLPDVYGKLHSILESVQKISQIEAAYLAPLSNRMH